MIKWVKDMELWYQIKVNQRIYKCPHCDGTLLDRVMVTHNGDRMFCRLCKKGVMTRQEVIDYFNEHTIYYKDNLSYIERVEGCKLYE